jgi:hypothetical protein
MIHIFKFFYPFQLAPLHGALPLAVAHRGESFRVEATQVEISSEF